MHEDVPQDEMTAEERAAAGVDPPNAAPAPDTSPPEEKTDDGNGEDGDGDDDEAAPDERTDDPKPVDDPNLPEEGDPDQFESEPINPGDMDPTSGEGSEAREEPADLSGVEKEFDED